MAAEPARVLDYGYSGYYGSAAPAVEPYERPAERPLDIPVPSERVRAKERAAAAQRAPVISAFAIFGTVFAGILFLFVLLAQISFNEIANETAKLNTQLEALQEQERRLTIKFESVVDMKEVERYARDNLGMSKPDSEHIAVIRSAPADSAQIISDDSDVKEAGGFGSFISSLIKHFRR